MTSSPNSPARLLRIEPSDLSLHPFLSEEDECYYLREYTSGTGFAYSPANDRISNLKKCPEKYRNKPPWPHKLRAITACGADFKTAVNPKFLDGAVVVPVPPSKAKGDPKYDDRMLQVAREFAPDVRELVTQSGSRKSAHECAPGARPSVAELQALYAVDEGQVAPERPILVILDDVLTTGRQYVAMRNTLRARFQTARIVGMFWARRVLPTDAVVTDFDVL